MIQILLPNSGYCMVNDLVHVIIVLSYSIANRTLVMLKVNLASDEFKKCNVMYTRQNRLMRYRVAIEEQRGPVVNRLSTAPLSSVC